MELIRLDGNSEICANVRSDPCCLNCVRHLIVREQSTYFKLSSNTGTVVNMILLFDEITP